MHALRVRVSVSRVGLTGLLRVSIVCIRCDVSNTRTRCGTHIDYTRPLYFSFCFPCQVDPQVPLSHARSPRMWPTSATHAQYIHPLRVAVLVFSTLE